MCLTFANDILELINTDSGCNMKKKIMVLLITAVILLIAVGTVILLPIFRGGVVFHCDFDENSSKTAKLINGNAEIVAGAGLNGSGLVLDGESGYMSLPKNILRDKMTIVIWLKRDASIGFERLFDFGSDNENYFFFSPSNGTGEIAVDGDKNWLGMPANKIVGEWQMFAVTADGYDFSFYINGVQKGGKHTAKYTLSQVRDKENYIGKSHFDDPYLKGTVDEITIYNKALSEEEIKAMFDKEMMHQSLKAEGEKLLVPDHVYEDIDLKAAAVGCQAGISWKSSKPKVLSAEGKVKPAGKDTDVKLTAILTDSETGAEYEREFTVTVVADGAKGRVEYIKNHLDIGIGYIASDITLPAEIDGASVNWRDNEYVAKDGRLINRPDEDTEVTLTADISYGGENASAECSVKVAGKTAAYLCTYISLYEYNTGVEFAEFPSHNYTDNARTDVMFYAVSEDGKVFKGLNNDRAVLYPYSINCTFGVPFEYKFGSPSLFRKADGSCGLICANDNITTQGLIYDTSDLITFTNQRVIDFGITFKNPTVSYNNLEKLYTLFFESDDGSYAVTTTDFMKFSQPYSCEYKKSAVSGELPIYAKADEAAVFPLTGAEYDRLIKKYGGLKSESVSYEQEVSGKAGKALELPKTATVGYNDGSNKEMGIIWDTASAGLDLENPKAGVYTVSGKINRPTYVSPLAECRADPYVIYNGQEGMYYFTSSYMQSDCGNAYAYVILRKAKTINELNTAEEVIVYDSSRGDAKAWYWAPELHYFGGQWRIILLSTWEGSGWECTLLSCKKDGDLLDPANWSAQIIGGDPDGKKLGAFDSTFFEYGGKSYYVTPSGNNIWIGEFDPENPTEIKTKLVKIGGASYSWEYNNGFPGTICDHQYVNEASSIMIHDGKIYLTYAGSTIDMHYCIGLLYADLSDDIMDPASWHKHPLPLLVTADLTETITEPVIGENGDTISEGEYKGSFGPGHNSITYDENGNPVVIYHARVWGEHFVSSGEQYGLGDPGRHAFAHSVNFDADGIPVMNLTPEQELAPELENVTVTVTVK